MSPELKSETGRFFPPKMYYFMSADLNGNTPRDCTDYGYIKA